ncbi:MAG: tRNA preQ1(34) S-adenosylmethionine ribosyltransferase-isomerase QueA, partial [Gemmatimonadetes bacterium]|nr:tRNA preQ1(34) S-adenosylmethionine ribosyltransferase-isomerase QueA [Gemmatimonadota bacterium]NIV88169.1 tRNA preQ1(34) S-adenosylmethionine ribosyltransferase-isomerase QueA [Actinomycetota bacterium]
PSRVVRFGDDARCEILEMLGGGLRRVRFTGRLDVDALMERYGSTPLPPYIHRAPEPD